MLTKRKIIYSIEFLILIGIIFLWIFKTPQGFYGKLNVIGYAFCHQLPDRSPFVYGHIFAFCYRCTGLFIGFFIGSLFQIYNRQNSLFTSPVHIAYCILSFLFFLLDSLNAYKPLHLIISFHLYSDTTFKRTLSGFFVGSAISLIIFPILFCFFQKPIFQTSSSFPDKLRFPLLITIGVFFSLYITKEIKSDVISLFVDITSCVSAIFLVTTLYAIILKIILESHSCCNNYNFTKDIFLSAFIITLLQLTIICMIRYHYTQNWNCILPLVIEV